MLSSRLFVGFLGLGLLACEVSTPPAQATPSTAPVAQEEASIAPPVAAEPALEPEPEAPPPEPPWSTAAGLAYREVVLGTTDPEQALPMVVAIHGLGDAPDNFRHLLDGFSEPCRVILPRGLDAVDVGWSWFPIRAADPDVEALAEGIEQAADRIAEGIEELRRTRPTKGKPIITGFSQGGMLTFALAVHHPEVVGHAIAIGGWLPPPLMPEEAPTGRSHPSIHALHGTADLAVAYEPTLLAVETLKERGFSVTLHSYEGVGHMINAEIQRDLFDQLSDAIVRERRRRSPK